MILRATDLDRTYSNAEFESLPEFSQSGYELIDGKVVYSMPGDEHGSIIGELFIAIFLYDQFRKLGKAWQQTSVDMGKGWIPVPDLTYIVAGRKPPQSSQSLKVVPDLVVEVWSPSDLDSKPERTAARAKIRKYQEVGVLLIWAINPRTKTVEVYHKAAELPVQVLTVSDILEGGEVIPGFSLPVAKLFD